MPDRLPELSIVLVGRKEEHATAPLIIAVTDRLIPSALSSFTLAELGAFRALAEEITRSVDDHIEMSEER